MILLHKGILLLLVLCSLLFSEVRFGGYLENNTGTIFDLSASYPDSTVSIIDTASILFTDVATLRLEGYWDFSVGGIETHLLIRKSFRPLIPFVESYKYNSAMWQISVGSIGSLLGGVTLPWDSSATPEDFWKDLNKEQQNLYSMLGSQLPYSSYYPATVLDLDRALIKLYFKGIDIYFGRQPITWGTGYAFNPTDLWNMKNPTDPQSAKLGVNALRLEIPIGALGGVSIIASPGRSPQTSSVGMRAKWNVGNFDMSVVGISKMDADRAMMLLGRKNLVGTDLAGQIGDIGVWYEVAGGVREENKNLTQSIQQQNPNYTFTKELLQIDIGLDYTFDNGLYLMGEYLYNNLGVSSKESYDLNGFINMFGGDASGFAKNYGFYGGYKEVSSALLQISLFSLTNFTDFSTVVMPGILYPFHENIEVELKSQIALGNKKVTEFGSMRNSVSLIVKGYF